MIEKEDRIIPVNIDEEMKSSYIDYSMSVIVSRALPDVRDGLKPVHRRVLYGMSELNNTSANPYKKSARIVGEVIGKYHPHGDSSIYGTLVRLAQPWAMRYRLVDGQGNFGSIDGDRAAAMRYTEARMDKHAEEMLVDLNKNTVDFQSNFDNTLLEPTVLPAKIPNLIINGSSGIAVGMATNMPPHNLTETIDACIAYIDDNEISIDQIIKHIKAPDFPTGGILYGYAGIKEAFETGKGRVVIRSKVEIETTKNGMERLVVTELPYNINKSELIKAIGRLVKDKRVEGISGITDLSNRKGLRIELDIKKDANANVVLNKLYKLSALQSYFSINNIALVNGRPKQLNIKELISNFVNHRHTIVTRRTAYELEEAQKRAHLLEGFITILDNLDEAIQIIRNSKTPDEARTRLTERFELSEIQARAVVEMRLRQLTGMEQDKLRAELEEIMQLIKKLNEILSKIELRMGIIKDELHYIKDKYGDERKSEIVYSSEEFNPEDFYANDDVIITISNLGYIKRTILSEFRTQGRGGVGSKGSDFRDNDFIEHIYPAKMHNTMLLFTQKGQCYWLKVYEIPEGSKNSKGRAIQNLLNIDADDKVTAYIRVQGLDDKDFINSHNIVFCTQQGMVKKTSLEAYSRPRQGGIIGINLRDNDQVIEVRLTDGNTDIILANKEGRAIRFHESKVRAIGRNGTGVKGMTLKNEQDAIIGMICEHTDEAVDILVVSEKGYGKRSDISEYRTTNRGGKGVKTLNITEKTGKLIAIKGVNDENDLMIINKSGVAIRISTADLRTMGRATQGVRIINLEKRNDEIASVCKVQAEAEETEESIEKEDNNNNE